MDLADALAEYERWMATTRDLSPHTVRAYLGDLEGFLHAQGRQRDVETIVEESVHTYVLTMRSNAFSTSTVRRRIVVLRSFCRWLRERGYLEGDPFANLTFDLPAVRRLPRALATSEVTALLKAMSVEPGPCRVEIRRTECTDFSRMTTLTAVALLLGTGLRVSELTSISIDDIDVGDGAIRVLGKGRRERFVYVVDPWLCAVLRDYLVARQKRSLAHTMLLVNGAGAPLSPTALRSRLSLAAKEAGLARRVTPHMLRHTAATQLIEMGVDIRFVQRLLGHASIATTELYTHVSDSALRRRVAEASVLSSAMR